MRFILFAWVLTTLAGCTQSAPPAKTVEFYRSHPAERAAVVQHCANDPGTLDDDPNCENALQAERLESIGSLRKLKPLDLGPTSR